MEAMCSPWRDVDMCKPVNSLHFLKYILGFCFRVSWFQLIPANTPQRQPASNDNYYDHKANEIQIKTVEKKKK